MLLANFLAIVAEWRPIFAQRRTHVRAVRQALGGLLCLGRRTITRILWTLGREQRGWAADYHLFSRAPWNEQDLFVPILKRGLAWCSGNYIGMAADDTGLRKTGRCIPQAFFQHDPLSPKFWTNLMWGLRFLQVSLLVPLYRTGQFAARALPIRFVSAPIVKRPSRKASEEEWKRYKADRKQHNLSQFFVRLIPDLRKALDALGAAVKTLVLSVDGSFCNRAVFAVVVAGVQIVARARKNAVLCFHAPAGSRRFYSTEKFTPEQVRKDKRQTWKTARIFYGGKRRHVRYIEVNSVYWQGGARRRLLRLFVVAPTRYLKRRGDVSCRGARKLVRRDKRKRAKANNKAKGGVYYYRQPAYLLTTDLTAPARILLQIYFDRWQIEVNHREEKDTLGVGQAQLWNVISVPRQPVFAVAAYSALLLTSLLTFGPTRTEAYAALPKWRRKAKRPSCLDLVTLLRKEAAEHPELLAPFEFSPTFQRLTAAAAA